MDVRYEEWELGGRLMLFDGREVRESALEPYLLMRAAYEDGATALVETMARFKDRADVQVLVGHMFRPGTRPQRPLHKSRGEYVLCASDRCSVSRI